MINHWQCVCGQYNAASLAECPKCGGRQTAPGTLTAILSPADNGSAFKGPKRKREPNKLEARYRREVLMGVPDCDCRFEGLTFTLASGARYKPDWIVLRDGRVECHEVKGPWESRDAKLRFRESAARWPMFRWVWAKWNGKQCKIEEVLG